MTSHKKFDSFSINDSGSSEPNLYIRITLGNMSLEDGFLCDLTNFLAYMADAIKSERESLGVYVILYLILFTIFSYLLYREFKKEVN